MLSQTIDKDHRVSFTLGILMTAAVVVLVFFYSQTQTQIREIDRGSKAYKAVADERFYSLLEVIRVQQVHNGEILTRLEFMESSITYHTRVDDKVKSPADVLGIISATYGNLGTNLGTN